MRAIELAEGTYFLRANIENGDLFEGLWPIPDGVSLNTYLVKGEKTAMIDLVRDWDNAPEAITGELKSLDVDYSDLDYLILNHLEPDHTGWLKEMHKKNPNIEIFATKKGIDLVKEFYEIEENLHSIEDGEELDLGNGKVIQFFTAPNVHWPETMVTYEKGTGILFSCDAFGSFGSLGDAVFDDEISDEQHEFYEKETLRYYANIVASFSNFVERAIKKLSDLDIKMIAPSHGIIWREDPKKIIDRYARYASYAKGTAEPEITIVWGSMYGNTQRVLGEVVRGIRSENVPVHIHQVPNEDVSYALSDAWKSTGLVLGMPTYEYKMFPPMAYVLEVFERKHVKNRLAFRFGSFGWSGGAQKELDSRTEKMKWDFLDPVEWQGAAGDEDMKTAYQRGAELARGVKEKAQ